MLAEKKKLNFHFSQYTKLIQLEFNYKNTHSRTTNSNKINVKDS